MLNSFNIWYTCSSLCFCIKPKHVSLPKVDYNKTAFSDPAEWEKVVVVVVVFDHDGKD